jgi:ABC transporter DrrB family efflux protein
MVTAEPALAVDCELVAAPPASVHHRPGALDQPIRFQAVQGGIDSASGEIEPSGAAFPQCFLDRIPVQRAVGDDLTNGMIDRFRALPMTRSAVLAGRTLADAVRNLFVLGLMTGIGYAIGFRFHAGLAAALAAIGLAIAVGVLLSWINALIGLLVRDPESAGLIGLPPVILPTFTSSTFVPIATMPGWLQAFAKINPITVTVAAMRALCLGGPTASHLWHAIAWLGGLLVLTIPPPSLVTGMPRQAERDAVRGPIEGRLSFDRSLAA